MYTVNDIEYTQLFIDSLGQKFIFTLSDESADRVNYLSINNLWGKWGLVNKSENVFFSFSYESDIQFLDNLEPFGESQISYWEIRKLSKKEFRLETNFENMDYKLILKRK